MSRRRRCHTTPDLLSWQPKDPVRAFAPEAIRAASLGKQLSKAVGRSLRECGQSRDQVASAMSDYLGEAVSQGILDKYASEAAEDHVINVVRFMALIHATHDRRLLQLIAGHFGWAVVEERHVQAIKLAALREQRDALDREAAAPEKTVKPTWRSKLTSAVAYCTNTASVVVVDRQAGTVQSFIGRAPGPDIAVYLREICFRAVATEVSRFKAGTFYRRRRSLTTKRQAVADFTDAMVIRLASRLLEIFSPTLSAEARREARAVRNQRYLSAVAHCAPDRETRFSEAAAQGWQAGGNIPLSHGVGGRELRKIGISS